MIIDGDVQFRASGRIGLALDAGVKVANDVHRGAGTRRLLLVSYQFPPAGGGAQRPVRFVKYLRRFGWEASVLVAAGPATPLAVRGLLHDIPLGTHIERARAWDPGYGWRSRRAPTEARASLPAGLLRPFADTLRGAASFAVQPDPQVLWVPSALRAGARLLRRVRHDAILATAPAYTNLLLGALLKERTGLPLVLDFRDARDIGPHWLDDARGDVISSAVKARLQRYVLRQADALITTTKASALRLQERARDVGSRASATCIYNGFDGEEQEGATDAGGVPAKDRDMFRLVYTGTLWNLTSIEPLVAAIEVLDTAAPAQLARLEVVVVGRWTEKQDRLLDRIKKTRCRLLVAPPCDQARSSAWMRSADALCLLLSDVESAHRATPAKLFEYLSARREILAIAPDGEVSDILKEQDAGNHFRPHEVLGITGWLLSRLQGGRRVLPADDGAKVATFSRERGCEQLVSVLDQLLLMP